MRRLRVRVHTTYKPKSQAQVEMMDIWRDVLEEEEEKWEFWYKRRERQKQSEMK